jgi:hypothetical protein
LLFLGCCFSTLLALCRPRIGPQRESLPNLRNKNNDFAESLAATQDFRKRNGLDVRANQSMRQSRCRDSVPELHAPDAGRAEGALSGRAEPYVQYQLLVIPQQ